MCLCLVGNVTRVHADDSSGYRLDEVLNAAAAAASFTSH